MREVASEPEHALLGLVCLVCGARQRLLFESRKYSYYRCESCGLVSTNPIPDAGAIAAHYEKNYADGNYAVLEQLSPDYLRVYEAYVPILERALRSSGRQLSGATVLDVGCFTGDFLGVIRERGAEGYGIELQAAAAKIAESRLPGRVFCGDLTSARLPVAEFDVITALGVIEHLPEPLSLISRAAEMLRPGGIFMIQTPDSGSLMARAMGRRWPPYTPVEHIHLFSRKSLRSVLTEREFTDVTFQKHWKWLTPSYVYAMLQTFGPSLHRVLRPIELLPRICTEIPLPFYVGEIIVIARK
jgi:2-polyprenyl-3-methyl-5-hydroxy-6-metoxy-1,4-benzoquinol methylase